jgi:hypothetical protein
MKITYKWKTMVFFSILLLVTDVVFAKSHRSHKLRHSSSQNTTSPEEVSLSKAEKAELDESRSPIGCKNMGYYFDLKTLQLKSDSVEAKQSLYFIYNNSEHNIALFHMRGEESSRSMFLNHKISPRQWAVLSTAEKRLRYICSIVDGKDPYGKITDCGDVIKVCQYNNVKYGLNNQGNYWLVNSNTRNGAVNAVVHYGIIPGV